MTQENQPTQYRKILTGLKKGDEAFFNIHQASAARATASQLKWEGKGKYKTKKVENGLYVTKLSDEN